MDDVVKRPKQAATPTAAAAPAGKGRSGLNRLLIMVSILCVLALGAAGFFFWKYHQIKTDPSGVSAAQTSALVSKVGKLISLPSGETPTIATVSDKTKLANQPFFKNAENGDKLLIYTNAKQAIIYRPSQNKIINVGPIAISDSTAGTTK